MAKYIDVTTLIVMFSTTYKNSKLSGEEIAKILQARFGDESSEESKAHASDRSINRPTPK